MKTKINTLIILSFVLSTLLSAQTTHQRPSVAVLYIDAQGFSLNASQMSSLTNVELLKLNRYEVIDRYDIKYAMEANNIPPDNCRNTSCMIDIGEKLNADMVLTGSVEILAEKIVINFRMINVKAKRTAKTTIKEYYNLPDQVSTMIKLTLQQMFGQRVDQELMSNLSQQIEYETTLEAPETETINMKGPRMGVTVFTGAVGELYELEKERGGFGASSIMLQFGYQFEAQYLNTGDVQALFEFIPLITGLDQGLFIPSFSVLHGLRSKKTGFEFAAGPVFSVVRMQDGRLHSDGDPTWNVGFVFGFGKTIRSGKLNFPINAFFIPGKSGHRFGISLGFNMVAYPDK